MYVRGGSILPIQPLVESTNETPNGPLTLRVYAGDNCSGQIYQDDGETFTFTKGDFLRERFACEASGESMRLRIGAREGTYPAWWKQIRVEIYGWSPAKDQVLVNGAVMKTRVDRGEHRIIFTIADDGKPSEVEVR